MSLTIVMLGQKGLPARSGGIERHVSLLAQGLASRGHRVIVYGRAWYAEKQGMLDGIEQIFTKGIQTKHLDAITHSLTALWHARSLKPDVIHIHGAGAALLTPLARILHRKAKVVVTVHSLDHVLVKWNWFAKICFRLGEWLACHTAHKTIAVSQALVRYCMEVYGCQATYITHPFILPKTIPSADVLKKFGLEKERYFLFVGRLIREKKPDLLIEAYEKARALCPDLFRDLPLVIVGDAAWTQEYVVKLKELAERVLNVKLLGERYGAELQALQAHALAHVFPYTSEGLSVATLEAAGYRRPVVVTNIESNREALGGFGTQVKPGDVADLARGLMVAAGQTEEERRAQGESLWKYVAKTFDDQARTDDIARIYAEIVLGDPCLVTQLVATA